MLSASARKKAHRQIVDVPVAGRVDQFLRLLVLLLLGHLVQGSLVEELIDERLNGFIVDVVRFRLKILLILISGKLN